MRTAELTYAAEAIRSGAAETAGGLGEAAMPMELAMDELELAMRPAGSAGSASATAAAATTPFAPLTRASRTDAAPSALS